VSLPAAFCLSVRTAQFRSRRTPYNRGLGWFSSLSQAGEEVWGLYSPRVARRRSWVDAQTALQEGEEIGTGKALTTEEPRSGPGSGCGCGWAPTQPFAVTPDTREEERADGFVDGTGHWAGVGGGDSHAVYGSRLQTPDSRLQTPEGRKDVCFCFCFCFCSGIK
jgi:hypothetical protein